MKRIRYTIEIAPKIQYTTESRISYKSRNDTNNNIANIRTSYFVVANFNGHMGIFTQSNNSLNEIEQCQNLEE